MIIGSTPATAYETTRASGARPSAFALAAVATTSAAAPSLMPEALPAVTLPSFLNAGLSAAELLGRRAGARVLVGVHRTGSPFFCGISTGTISALKLPSFSARSARCWLSAENASWSARDTP